MASVHHLGLFPFCLQDYETATQEQKDNCNLQLSLEQVVELFWRVKKLKAKGGFSLGYRLYSSAFSDNTDSYEGCSLTGNYVGVFQYWPLNMTNSTIFEVISPFLIEEKDPNSSNFGFMVESESEQDLVCQQGEIFDGSNVAPEDGGSFDSGSEVGSGPRVIIDSGNLKSSYRLNCSFDWENALATYDSNKKISTVYVKADIRVLAGSAPNWNQPTVAGCEGLYVKDGEYFHFNGYTAEEYRSYIKNRDENSFSYENRDAEKDTTMQFKLSDGPSIEIDLWTEKNNFQSASEKDITSMTEIELSIEEWWEYDPNDGKGPKYDKHTGEKLRDDI